MEKYRYQEKSTAHLAMLIKSFYTELWTRRSLVEAQRGKGGSSGSADWISTSACLLYTSPSPRDRG
eukprot:3162232-Rhodomonas_salina.1